MNFGVMVLIIFFLTFVLLPAVSVSLAYVIRYIYRAIHKKKNNGIPTLITATLIAVTGLAILPPLPFFLSPAHADVYVTESKATITYDDKYDDNFIRYIKHDGQIYQELIPSISTSGFYDYSEDMVFEYGVPIANIWIEGQNFMERYIYKIFRYPVNSRLIYPVLNEGMTDYISLDQENLFLPEEIIDEKIKFYSDAVNYNYFVEDFNSEEFHEINLDADTVMEILKLVIEAENADSENLTGTIPGIITVNDDADYDVYSLIGESIDGLLLKSIGDIYAKDNKMYQIVDEIYLDDGTVSLYLIPLSIDSSDRLLNAFIEAGLNLN